MVCPGEESDPFLCLWRWIASSRETSRKASISIGGRGNFLPLRTWGDPRAWWDGGVCEKAEKGEARLQHHSMSKWPLSTPAQTSHLHTHSLPPGQRLALQSLGLQGIYGKGHQKMKARAGHSQSWILNTTVRKSVFISGPASVDWVPQKIYIKAIFSSKCVPKNTYVGKMLNAFRFLFP